MVNYVWANCYFYFTSSFRRQASFNNMHFAQYLECIKSIDEVEDFFGCDCLMRCTGD